MAIVKSAGEIGSGINSLHIFEVFGLLSLVCKVNRIPLLSLSFGKSYRTLYEMTMKSLDYDSQLF